LKNETSAAFDLETPANPNALRGYPSPGSAVAGVSCVGSSLAIITSKEIQMPRRIFFGVVLMLVLSLLLSGTDKFSTYQASLTSPAEDAFAITPHNTNDLANFTRAIWVGGTGDVKVNMVGSGTVTFTSVPAGYMLAVRASRVYATGTGATALVGVY
jgi:hypothetical protein